MRSGEASQTAVLVCMGRALAHERLLPGRFSDPTAITMLPDEARARVERVRSGGVPKDIRGRMSHGYLRRQSQVMAARTVEIDDAIRAVPTPQLVVLGAGLDGRAWRMSELRDTVVFEVDHPDTQRAKRARASTLTPRAREIRFVPVDFTRDSLDEALAKAGHDPTVPTTWLWEGVVMYLTRADVESTLRSIQRRSAERSRLIVVYHSPATMLLLVSFFVRRYGEPLRSKYEPDQMRSLLARHGFRIVADRDLAAIAEQLALDDLPPPWTMKHLRIATAERAYSSRS